MDEKTVRLLEIVLFKIGFDGGRTINVSPPRPSGNHAYRDIVIEGHPPLVSIEAVSNGLIAWLEEASGRIIDFNGFRYEVGPLVAKDGAASVRISIIGLA